MCNSSFVSFCITWRNALSSPLLFRTGASADKLYQSGTSSAELASASVLHGQGGGDSPTTGDRARCRVVHTTLNSSEQVLNDSFKTIALACRCHFQFPGFGCVSSAQPRGMLLWSRPLVRISINLQRSQRPGDANRQTQLPTRLTGSRVDQHFHTPSHSHSRSCAAA